VSLELDKALLILDIDETLIHATPTQLNIKETCIIFDYYVYFRPYLSDFLDSVSLYYNLALWSSASDDYVYKVVENTILKEYDFKFVWGRSKATFRRNYELDELRIYGNTNDHYHYVKSLKKVKKLGFPINRVLIVDDSPHKSKLNYGNAIYPSAFEGNQDDIELRLLTIYLEKIKDHTNYRKLEKRGWKNSVLKNYNGG